MLNSFQSPLYRVFFFNIDEALESYRHSKVSVPIISGLLFQLIALGGAALYRRPFQSPLYRVFFFNWSETTTRQAYSLFQSPLYRVFFFNKQGAAEVSVDLLSFSPHYIGSSFSTHTGRPEWQMCLIGFSPHYIGSSFSTELDPILWYLEKSFSPHYIGSSFSTIRSWEQPSKDIVVSVPIISGLLFQLLFTTQYMSSTKVSVPIISGLLFQRIIGKLSAVPFIVSVPIISGLLFQQKELTIGSQKLDLVSVPIISGLLFQLLVGCLPAYSESGFSPHYIGSSFST